MHLLMVLEMPVSFEGLSASFIPAEKRSLSCVDSIVSLQIAFLIKRLVASSKGAFEWPVSCLIIE
jgi:hypothetical protein